MKEFTFTILFEKCNEVQNLFRMNFLQYICMYIYFLNTAIVEQTLQGTTSSMGIQGLG